MWGKMWGKGVEWGQGWRAGLVATRAKKLGYRRMVLEAWF